MTEKFDDTTKGVLDMYSKYPYPSISLKTKTNELLNLFRFFSLENKIEFKHKKILDAGTGTGHRIIQVAKYYDSTTFSAIDMSERSLSIAKMLKKQYNLSNIEFLKANLMNELDEFEKFDVVLCMGVLHHLSNPDLGIKNLVQVLKKNGIIFLYLYGRLGSYERMRRKKIIQLLLNENKQDYDLGIKLVKELKFDEFEYGWNMKFNTSEEEKSVIVDAFLHYNEKLYDFDEILNLMKKTGLYGFAIFGITTETQGILFDTRLKKERSVNSTQTDITQKLKSPLALKLYDSLNIIDKCRFMDLLYKPNGYTIIGLTEESYKLFSEKSRIRTNFIKCE